MTTYELTGDSRSLRVQADFAALENNRWVFANRVPVIGLSIHFENVADVPYALFPHLEIHTPARELAQCALELRRLRGGIQ